MSTVVYCLLCVVCYEMCVASCAFLSLSLPPYHSLSMSLFFSPSLPPSLSLSLPLYLPISLSLYLYLTLPLPSPSLPPSLSPSHCSTAVFTFLLLSCSTLNPLRTFSKNSMASSGSTCIALGRLMVVETMVPAVIAILSRESLEDSKKRIDMDGRMASWSPIGRIPARCFGTNH